jgi:hypothetical protein
MSDELRAQWESAVEMEDYGDMLRILRDPTVDEYELREMLNVYYDHQ